MASVKLILRKDKKNQDGKAPLFIRVIQHRKATFISLGIYLKLNEWNDVEKKVRKTHSNPARLNNFIAKKVAETEGALVDMQSQNRRPTTKKIKQEIQGMDPVDFFEFADQYMQSLVIAKKIGMIKRVGGILEKLKVYMNGTPLSLHDIDVAFLVKYEDYLLGTVKNRINTVSANLKIVRKILNDAIRQGLIKRDDNPFFSYRLKTETSHKEYLTEAELKAIEKLKLIENSKIALSRDMYVFSAYTGGIRISDILTLRWKYFDGERLHFKMSKTNRDVMVKLPNKALEILKRYQPGKVEKNGLIFPFLNTDLDLSEPIILYNAISSATALCNKNLKIIAKRAKIEKKFTFHSSRHTFATRALRKGIRIEYVSKLLGHASIEETQIYAQIINEELDKAMEVFNE